MAGDRFYRQKFIFSDGSFQDKYIWESEVVENKTDKFPTKDGEVGEPFFNEVVEPDFTVVQKMNVNQIQQDRIKRSREHFKKEVWETIPKSERKLFRNRTDLKQ